VKSGNVGAKDVRDLRGVVEREEAQNWRIDLYGRFQPDKFREIWEGFNKRLRESKA